MRTVSGSFSAHAVPLPALLSEAVEDGPRVENIGLWAKLRRGLGAPSERRRLTRLDRRSQSLRRLLRRRKGVLDSIRPFLFEALELHDQVVGRLGELASQELCLSWRERVLDGLERQVRLAGQASRLGSRRLPPDRVLPSTVMDEQLRNAAATDLDRQAERERSERDELIQGLRDVQEAMLQAG